MLEQKSEALHKISKGSKSQRSCNSGWWTSYEVLLFAAHVYVTFLQWIYRWCHSSCVISFSRWLEEVEYTSFTGKYVPPCGWFFFSESLYCIEMVLFHHAVSTKHSMRYPVENTQDVICPRESMCVPALRRWGHMGRSNSAQITGCNITQPLNWLQVSRCLQRVAVRNHVSEQEVLSCSAQFSMFKEC